MDVIRVQLPEQPQQIVDRKVAEGRVADGGECRLDIAEVRVRLCDVRIGMVLSALG
jgi:hypothetical protein